MTSGRHSATASATASRALHLPKHAPAPSSRRSHVLERRRRPPRRSARRPARELLADRRGDRSSEITPLSAAKPPSSTALGSGRPRCSRAISVAGTVSRRSWRKRSHELAEPELVEAARGVDQDVAVGLEPAEDVHLVQQRRVLDDQRVGLGDRLARPDRPIVDAAERRPPGRRCAPSRRSGRPGRGGPRRRPRSRASRRG